MMALLVLASLVATAAAVEVTCLTTQTEIDFVSATLMYNNLGGMGPNFDEPAMLRYAGVGTKDGDRVDLTVTAVTAYVPSPSRARPTTTTPSTRPTTRP